MDFVSLEFNLIIEVDGPYHTEQEQQQYDNGRTAQLESLGFKVLRFTNDQVLNQIDNVIETIKKNLYEE